MVNYLTVYVSEWNLTATEIYTTPNTSNTNYSEHCKGQSKHNNDQSEFNNDFNIFINIISFPGDESVAFLSQRFKNRKIINHRWRSRNTNSNCKSSRARKKKSMKESILTFCVWIRKSTTNIAELFPLLKKLLNVPLWIEITSWYRNVVHSVCVKQS